MATPTEYITPTRTLILAASTTLFSALLITFVGIMDALFSYVVALGFAAALTLVGVVVILSVYKRWNTPPEQP